MLDFDGSLSKAEGVVREDGDGKAEEGRAGIAERVDLAPQGLLDLLKGVLDRPPLEIQLGHAVGIRILPWEVREQVDLGLAAARGMIEPDDDPADHERLITVLKMQVLLVNHARFAAPALLRLGFLLR